jgi:hypothetical protein
MKRFDEILFGLVIGLIFPIMIGLLSVLIWFYTDRQETHAPIYALIGLSSGLLLDLMFLKRWINNRYVLPIWFVVGIYILYNICIYGFFMGLPVFNTFLGLLAGYYFGKRICFNKVESETHTKLINQVSIFAGLIMTFVCISSGFLAIYDNGAAGMIQNVLGLSFEVTSSMLWGIVLIGGFILISINVLLTRFTMIKTIKNYAR